MAKFALTLAGLFGVAAVGLGAFGAHALGPSLGERGEKLWALASHYALVHAAALLALGAWLRAGPGLRQAHAGLLVAAFGLGTVLFAGSLYALALGAPRALGAVTPAGGLLLLAGWALVAWCASP